MKNTVLDRRIVEPNREVKAVEWVDGYWISMQKGVQENTQLIFTLNNLQRRNDAHAAACTQLRDVDVSTVTIPSKNELKSKSDKDLSHLLMQYTPKIRDSKYYWKMEQQLEIGTKRDFEYINPQSRPYKTHPTYASLFRTMAPPYNKAYYIQKLLGNNEIDLHNPIL